MWDTITITYPTRQHRVIFHKVEYKFLTSNIKFSFQLVINEGLPLSELVFT